MQKAARPRTEASGSSSVRMKITRSWGRKKRGAQPVFLDEDIGNLGTEQVGTWNGGSSEEAAPSRLKIGGASPCQNFTSSQFGMPVLEWLDWRLLRMLYARCVALRRLPEENLGGAFDHIAAEVAGDDGVTTQGEDIKPRRKAPRAQSTAI